MVTQRAPTESSRADTKAETSGRFLPSVRRAEWDDSASFPGIKPPRAPADGPVIGGSTPGLKPVHRGPNNRTGDRCASSRVFYAPQGLRPRLLLHGFVDTFKSQVRPCGASGWLAVVAPPPPSLSLG